MKADSFSFRIQQAATRILRDLQKADVAFQKTIAAPYSTFAAETAEGLSKKSKPIETLSAQSEPVVPALPQVTSQRQAATAPNDDRSDTVSPTPDELTKCLLKHRHRIKNTPAKDRPALVARLLEQERTKLQALQSAQAA